MLSARKSGEWDDLTSSPGCVMIDPLYEKDKMRKKYMMFYSGSCSGSRTMRSLGIARTNTLDCTDDYDKPAGDFWVKDSGAIFPPEHDVENSSVFFDGQTGLYWLFTNHIYNNEYTDSIWAYWSDDPNVWDPENRAVVFDSSVSKCAKGAIGMPSCIVGDYGALYMFYDAAQGTSIGHLNRSLGVCKIALPLRAE